MKQALPLGGSPCSRASRQRQAESFGLDSQDHCFKAS